MVEGGGGQDQTVRHTSTDCSFEFRDERNICHQTPTVGCSHLDTQLLWVLGLRLVVVVLEVNRNTTAISLMQHCAFAAFIMWCKATQYPSVCSASKGTSCYSKAHSIEGSNNEPIHIKRHNESPVSRLAKTTGCRGEEGADKSCVASKI